MFRKHFTVFAAGSALALAFPPFAGGIGAFAGLVPLLWWLRNSDTMTAAQTGFVWGLGFNAASLYWICYSTMPGGIASIVLLALFSIVVPVAYSFGYRVWGEGFVWFFPFLWVGWEYFRSFGDLGFPWVIMGNTQTYQTTFVQFISYTGVLGASFWICLVNILVYKLIRCASITGKLGWGTATVLIVGIPYVHGLAARHYYETPGTSVRLSLVQGNIDPWAKWDNAFKDYNFQTYEALSQEAGNRNPELLIWPESAATSYLRYDAKYLAWVKKISENLHVPIFTGALDAEFEEERRIYNAAFLIRPHVEELQSYRKMQLVPLSERFPFRDYIPELFRLDFGQGPSDFSRGEGISLFDLSGGGESNLRFVAVICYESVFSSLVREFCKQHAEFLIIITNDAWFGKSSGTYQHAQYAVLRAIEHRIPVARCANTGISMFVNPLGDILARTPIEKQALLSCDLPVRSERTFYTEHGDWFPLIVSFIAIAGFLATFGKFTISARDRRRVTKASSG